MTSKQLEIELSTALARRSEAGAAFEQASAAMPLQEHAALDAGARADQLTPSQTHFFAALRVYNRWLDRVQALEVELEMVIAIEAFEALTEPASSAIHANDASTQQ